MGTVYLASKSPRRRAILEGLGLSVRVIASNAHTLRAFEGDETVNPGEAPEDYVKRTARNKFLEGLAVRDASGLAADLGPVLAADTVVSIGGDILGKPRDESEARAFLRRLSGRTHEVRTAVVAGYSQERCESALSVSEVTFRPMSGEEILAYVRTGEPYDKAGGYGIQGLAGIYISRIAGSYTGIMGLPVFETAALLSRMGVRIIGRSPSAGAD